MERSIIYNKNTALCLVCITAVLSILFGGARGLNRIRDEAVTVYERGVLSDGICISSDITSRANLGERLLSIGRGYLSETEPSSALLRNVVDELYTAETIEKRSELNNNLTIAALSYYNVLRESNLSEKDRESLDSSYRELAARNSTISNDGYNDLAASYNNTLNAFPANVIKAIGFAKVLPSFTGVN